MRRPIPLALAAVLVCAAPASAQTYTLPDCERSLAFDAVGVQPRGNGGFAYTFTRQGDVPVAVELFQQSLGRRIVGERRIARLHRGEPIGRLRDGFYVVRFSARAPDGSIDRRRVVLQRRNGRFLTRPAYERVSCGLLRLAKLERPVFGGAIRNDALGIAFRVAIRSQVSVTVRRAGRVVKRYKTLMYAADRTHRLRFAARGRRGDYAVTISATAGDRRETLVVTTRRL